MLKKLDFKKQALKIWIDNLNSSKSIWIETMNSLKEKTKWSLGEYIDLLLNVLNADATNLKDHYKWIDLLTSEKGKQFENSQSMKHLNNKKNKTITQLKNLKESLESGEANSFKKFRIYNISFVEIIGKENKELSGNNNIIQLLYSFIDILSDCKEASNKRYEKLVKMLKSKLQNYSSDFPLIELWEFLSK